MGNSKTKKKIVLTIYIKSLLTSFKIDFLHHFELCYYYGNVYNKHNGLQAHNASRCNAKTDLNHVHVMPEQIVHISRMSMQHLHVSFPFITIDLYDGKLQISKLEMHNEKICLPPQQYSGEFFSVQMPSLDFGLRLPRD